MPAERKLVTVLFADIVGSTAITVARDPEVVRNALQHTFDEVRPIIETHGGTVEKFIGDEVMAVFGVPRMHDDDADRAVRAAFAIRDRVRELSGSPKAVPFELRIGVNSGEAVAGAGEGGQFLVTGEPVIAAARIRASAEPGEIAVGALTHRLTQRAVEYGEPREFEAKGLGRISAWPVMALRSDVPTQFRGVEGLRAPLIGRDEELTLLRDTFERVKSEGRPHLVTVFGAAGAGKSRLTEEFVAAVEGAQVRQGRCLPYGEGITLWPVQNILRAEADIAPSDDLAAARRRLRDAVTAAFPDSAEDVDAVGRRLEVLCALARADEVLSDVAASDLSDELAWGLRRYLERRAAQAPLVLVFEDIHWAAPALLELIAHLAEWSTAPLLLLCLARPEFLDTRPGWGGGKLNAATVVLEPLTPDETRLMIARLLDIDALSEDLRQKVIERSEGNPLYVEEFVRLLIESGHIGSRDGRWVAVASAPLHVPPTLQGLIAARIDTAPARVKALLQRGAVIGRAFSTAGVAALSDDGPPDPADLRDAARRDLLVSIDERGVGGGRVYRFKHVLIRDVVYASIPKAERSALHDRYVRWYEETLGDRRSDFIDLIAYHAEQAYLLASEMGLPETADLARRAFDRLMEAATNARLREDDAAALALYQRAGATVDDASVSDERRLELDTYLALSRHSVEASPEANAEVDRAIDRARALGATRPLVDLLEVRYRYYQDERHEQLRQEMMALARDSGEPDLMVRALMSRITRTSTADEDVAYATEALAYATAHGLDDWRRRCLSRLAETHTDSLRFTEAARLVEELEQVGGVASTRRQRAEILVRRALLLAGELHAERAIPLYDEAIGLRRDLGDIREEAFARLFKCRALAQLGRWGEATALGAVVIDALAGKATPGLNRVTRVWQARFFAASGRVREARVTLDAALEFATSNAWVELWTLWASAVVLSAEGDLEAALHDLMEAQARANALQVAEPLLSLDHARILKQAGRAAEARRVLEDLHALLTDPLADRLRARTDELLAEIAVPAT